MQILTNHLGYLPNANKRALISVSDNTKIGEFSLINAASHKTVLTGKAQLAGPVDKWKNKIFWTIDFSEFSTPGNYFITATDENGKTASSHLFEIREGLISETVSDILYYFKGQRCADEWDKQDLNCPVYNENRTVDVHGGWYDASGDVSKYLSHLSYANFMNPQQTPLVVWAMFKAAADLTTKNAKKDDYAVSKIIAKMTNEAMYGADFLRRMQDPSGAFYMTVFDQWTADIKERMICEYVGQDGKRFSTWQCAHRQGAGMSIAALAMAAKTKRTRDYTSEQYLETAIKGFDHLEKNNTKYCNDGKENIIDDYCALLAATELYDVTKEQRFFDAAKKRATSLINRISEDKNFKGWLRADDGTRTFYHGAEAGLPVIALLNLKEKIDDTALEEKILSAVKQIMTFELTITDEVNNPFGYPRQYISPVGEEKRSSFFMAQNNESGYWWQGENARIASLATAARYTARYVDKEFALKLEEYATNCINWVLGLNPFDVCMLQGRGYNNPTYEHGFPNAPGGMCNGATAGFTDSRDIDFNPEEPEEATTGNHRWRWGEQWIPHSGWYALAVSSENE
jgi:hypothetical protein